MMGRAGPAGPSGPQVGAAVAGPSGGRPGARWRARGRRASDVLHINSLRGVLPPRALKPS